MFGRRNRPRSTVLAIAAGLALIPLVGRAQVAAALVAADSSVQPGRPLMVALRLVHGRGWHTYWSYPGIGRPTKLAWELPNGWRAGEIVWPTPRLIHDREGTVIGQGYDGVTYLPVTLAPSAGAIAGERANISVVANWLMCSDLCIPGEGSASLSLPISRDPPQRNTEVTAALAQQSMPDVATGWTLEATREDKRIVLTVVGDALGSPHFFTADGFIQFDAPQTVSEGAGGTRLELPIADDGPTGISTLVGVLAFTDTAGAYRGIHVATLLANRPSASATLSGTRADAVYIRASTGIPLAKSLTPIWLLAALGGLVVSLLVTRLTLSVARSRKRLA